MRKVTRLGKWQWGAAPPALSYLLGWPLVASGSENIVIVWFLLLLPFVWAVVATTIVLTLSPGERLVIRGSWQPFLFFFFWAVSAVWSLFTLPSFPFVSGDLAVPGKTAVIITCVTHLIVIAVVVWIFSRQCKRDIREGRI